MTLSLILGLAWASPPPVAVAEQVEEVALLRSLAPGPPPGAPAGPALPAAPGVAGGLELRRDADVATWVGLYEGALRGPARGWLARLDAERGVLELLLEGEGLPPALAVLPVVESGLLTEATSTTGCAGPWQLAAPTARALGLRVDATVDERRDRFLAGAAGVALLAQLRDHYGDLDLALAAYNAGQGTVDAAMAGAGGRSFDAVRPRLSSEARHFVAKVHAMVWVDRLRRGG